MIGRQKAPPNSVAARSKPHVEGVGQTHAEAVVDPVSGLPHRFRKNGPWYLGASPSRKSVQRLKDGVGEMFVPGNMGAWPEVRDRLNRKLRGRTAYFDDGRRLQAYRAVDNHVYDRARHFLTRRHEVPGRGGAEFPAERVFGELGVLRLRDVHLGSKPKAAT